MTIPPTVTGALDVAAGDQVLAVALPGTGRLQLLAAADALQEATGEFAPDPVAPAAVEEATVPAPASRTRVRPAFGHRG